MRITIAQAAAGALLAAAVYPIQPSAGRPAISPAGASVNVPHVDLRHEARLGSAAAKPNQRSLAGYGMRVKLPPGWHGHVSHGLIVAATFPIGAGDTGFGASAAKRVGGNGVLQVLSEEETSYSAGHELCLPRTRAPALTLTNLRRATRRHELITLTTLFCLSSRHFILWGHAGPGAARAQTVAAVDQLLASFIVRRGDFYPGRVQPARFPAATGWHVGSSGPGANAASGEQTESFAATIAYANAPNDLPPVRTVHKLGPDGILIWLGLSRDSRRLPPAFAHETPLPLRIDAGSIFTNWEGNGDYSRYGLYRQTAFRRGQYDLDLWVFFAAAHPGAATIARAQREIDAVVLPHWPPF
jgi:hypothetical protein